MKRQFVKPQLRELTMAAESILASSSTTTNPQVGGNGTTTGEQNAREMSGSPVSASPLDVLDF